MLRVTPHAGVWIEIYLQEKRSVLNCVTPHAGVWIEILRQTLIKILLFGHAPRGRVD